MNALAVSPAHRALCGQDDFTALKSIRSQETVWMPAGRRLRPPAGKTFIFSPSTTSKDGAMSGERRGDGCGGVGGSDGCSPERPASLW